MIEPKSIWRSIRLGARATARETRWQKLCAVYLPRATDDSMWRYSSGKRRSQPSFGWKLHVSATILNAPTVLKRIAPVLAERGACFKAPRSLLEVMKLNSGLYYSYSQIGKIITIYPANDREAVYLARRLHQLTRRLTGPSVPFDLRFTHTSNVYYRFGAFQHLVMDRGGRRMPAVYTPDGDLVPDVREQAKPDWVSDPFAARRPESRSPKENTPSLCVIRALVQRGKGGVYQAIDFSGDVPQLCLLKEGRKNGELTWDGRDGAWRVRHEKRVLARLAACGVPVPRVHSSFEVRGNYYLVTDYLKGETLHELLLRRQRRLSIAQILGYGFQLATFVSQMHDAGWAWRDCKPKNIIVTRDGRLVPIDFEGAAPIKQPDHQRWGTPGFTPPEWHKGKIGDGVAEDLYALGAILYLLLTGRVFDRADANSIMKFRQHIPPKLCRLVHSLLSDEPIARPRAQDVRSELNSILLKDSKQSTSWRHKQAA